MSCRFIVGLGNPGESYAASRHNVGFLVADAFASDAGFAAMRKKRNVDYSEREIGADRVFLVKPRSYMNESGTPVREFLGLFGALEDLPARGGPAPEGSPGAQGGGPRGLADSLIVVHDDLDLPIGKLRFRAKGSSGGHRGVASLISSLGTDEFGRLKVGIGREVGRDAAEYVLERPGAEERRRLLEAAERSAKTLWSWIREGIEACANRFNGEGGELRSEV